ncbi:MULTISPECIES: FecR family protein [unclassified Sphingobacterium]|uniref:FecR family protein n=1 Tax=unclassified Sphingobacterium TaxID=2609468 RepID=UPI0025F7EB54|nr:MULTISPECIES: FecR family protein [unclassified Sphingobacterium]
MKITKTLIDKYLSGKASAEEIAAVENALANNEFYWEDFMPETEWQAHEMDSDFKNQKEIKARIFKQLGQKNSDRFSWLKYAAIILFIGIGAWLGLTQIDFPEHTTAYRIAKKVQPTPQEKPDNLYYINSGNTVQHIEVPDGSTIELFPNSEVKFSSDFADITSRDIQLKGKAKFTVAKNKAKPFRVHTADLTTTALGTVFSVEEGVSAITKIKLYEGRIEVTSNTSSGNKKPLNLHFLPNEEISIDRKQQQIVAETRINASQSSKRGSYLKTSGQLIFKNLPLHAVLHIISHNYAVKLNFEPKDIQDKYYSGTYKNTASAYLNMLADIQALHRITIHVQTE